MLFEQHLKDVGDLGAPTMYMPRMNIQCLYIEKMGCERAIYALADWPDAVEAFFRAQEECHHRLIELFAPRLVLGISDEISSTGNIERIRVVGDTVDAYNAQFE